VVILMPALNMPRQILEELVSGISWAIEEVTG
jgi:hypothetical protein